ncbi:hypothetical protein FRC11_006903 [Ceratobasidium sp. 423]|nr:hypothetical protein FRC11_006903 [Ceratobasidium sp. 423]
MQTGLPTAEAVGHLTQQDLKYDFDSELEHVLRQLDRVAVEYRAWVASTTTSRLATEAVVKRPPTPFPKPDGPLPLQPMPVQQLAIDPPITAHMAHGLH